MQKVEVVYQINKRGYEISTYSGYHFRIDSSIIIFERLRVPCLVRQKSKRKITIKAGNNPIFSAIQLIPTAGSKLRRTIARFPLVQVVIGYFWGDFQRRS